VHQERYKARSGEVGFAVAVYGWWRSRAFANPTLYSTCVLCVLAEPDNPRASWCIAQGSIGGDWSVCLSLRYGCLMVSTDGEPSQPCPPARRHKLQVGSLRFPRRAMA
jgi:hypothetical protein